MAETQTGQGPKLGSDRVFGFVFAGVFVLIAGWPLLRGEEARLWCLPVALAFLAAALIRPKILRPLNLLWFRLGQLLHKVMTPVVMAILFVVLVIPMGLLLRLSGRDPLRLKSDPGAASYWILRDPPGPPPASLRDQF